MIAAAPKQAPSATLVIFGAMGDLTRRLLVPALANLRRERFIGDEFNVLAIDKQDIYGPEAADALLARDGRGCHSRDP